MKDIEKLVNEINILSQILDAVNKHNNKTHYTGIERKY